ncbi:hypothetical protein [Pseudomonas akapageensis]|uniref:hypothetical protein n=1 Tax=Pseudomonas akapageensis TaxID=2609961 RepID=UPI00140A5B2E|nr:hypothetical protein [Pseudomonas akapageensis]
MTFSNQLAILAVTASIFGCTTSSDHTVNVNLTATRQNAGQIANTILYSQGNQTGFNFFISGIPNGTNLPLRLYTFINKGSCQQPGPVAYAMNDQVNTQRIGLSGWSYERSAPVAMQELLSGGYSIVVRTAPDDGNVDIFCGDIRQGAR